MPVVYIDGDLLGEEERAALLKDAFDAYMLKIPLEQRRFLRRFGYTETEIDAALQDPSRLTWEVRAPASPDGA